MDILKQELDKKDKQIALSNNIIKYYKLSINAALGYCSDKCHICERGYVDDKTSPFYCDRSGNKEYEPACKGLIFAALNDGKYTEKTDEMVGYLKLILHSAGKRWQTGRSYSNFIGYSIFGCNTCYLFNEGFVVSVFRARLDGYNVLEWSDFKERKFTKSDLKDGMVVKTSQHESFFVYKGRLVNHSGWLNISNYTDNLEDPTDAHFTINKVYDPRALATIDDLFYPISLDLIWEREDTTKLATGAEPVEMTLKEVCEALGREIKIIK